MERRRFFAVYILLGPLHSLRINTFDRTIRGFFVVVDFVDLYDYHFDCCWPVFVGCEICRLPAVDIVRVFWQTRLDLSIRSSRDRTQAEKVSVISNHLYPNSLPIVCRICALLLGDCDNYYFTLCLSCLFRRRICVSFRKCSPRTFRHK